MGARKGLDRNGLEYAGLRSFMKEENGERGL
jgi:hypothetical protein